MARRKDAEIRLPDTAAQTLAVLRGTRAAEQLLWRALFFRAAAEAGVPTPRMTGDIASFQDAVDADAFGAWMEQRLGLRIKRFDVEEGKVAEARHCVTFFL